MITYIDYPLQENVILILSYFLLFFVTDINFKADFHLTLYIEYFIDSARVRLMTYPEISLFRCDHLFLF